MINIKEFKVDKIILLISIIRRGYENGKNDIYDYVFSKLNKDEARMLWDISEEFSNKPYRYKEIMQNKELGKSLECIFEFEEFEKVYEDTLRYKDKLEEQWEDYKDEVNKYFLECLRLDTKKDILANIINPYYRMGTNDMNNEVFFGHVNGIDNPVYNIVYLMHESMHCILPYKKEWNYSQRGICHSVIELATDNELRCRLEGKTDTYNNGHKDGLPQTNKLLPLWCAFLGKTSEEIEQLNKCKDIDFNMYRVLNRKKFRNMTFPEFMEYCIENYKELEFSGQAAMKHEGISKEEYKELEKEFKEKNHNSTNIEYEVISKSTGVSEEQLDLISEIYKSSFNNELSKENIKQRLNGGSFTLLRLDGKAQGFIYESSSDKETYIKELCIRKGVQNNGLGTLLLGRELLEAKKNGKTVYLSINPNNSNAYYIYKNKFDFEYISEDTDSLVKERISKYYIKQNKDISDDNQLSSDNITK